MTAQPPAPTELPTFPSGCPLTYDEEPAATEPAAAAPATETEPPTFPSGCPLTYDEEPAATEPATPAPATETEPPTFPSGCPLTYDEEPAATAPATPAPAAETEPPTFPSGCPLTYDEEPAATEPAAAALEPAEAEPTFPSGCPLTYDEEPAATAPATPAPAAIAPAAETEPTFPSGCPLTYDEAPAAEAAGPEFPSRSAPESEPEPAPDSVTASAGTEGLIRLYGPEFAADNTTFYARMRERGPVVPVEVAPGVRALLVTDYRTALEVLHNTEVWSKDPRVWQRDLPADSPVRPLLEYRATALFVDGKDHRRYRDAIRESFDRFEPHVLRSLVQRTADRLIQRFAAKGEADLMHDFALGLPIALFSELFGLHIDNDQLAAIVVGQASVRPGVAQAAYAEFARAMAATIEAKRLEPGNDLVSYLLAHHTELSPVEVLDELLLTVGVANDPTSGLIGSTLMLMLTDERYSTSLTDGALTVHDAMRVVQWRHSPVGNYAAHYPLRDVTLGGMWIDAHSLVMISFGAINSALAPEHPEEAGNGGRAHLGFSAGPHACPAKAPATIVAATAIERLTSFLPTLQLAVPAEELKWREGGFLRSLTSLPVRFAPVSPEQAGATPWTPSTVPIGVH